LLASEYGRWSQMWDAAAERYGCVVLQNNFEMLPYRVMGNMDAAHPNGRLRFISDLNARMYAYREQSSRFYINDIHYLSALFGLDAWQDARAWYLYKYALALDAIPLLSHSLATIIKAVYGKNKKALMLDMDNTLWGGVVGDDGPENIRLGPETPEGMAFSDFQKYVRAVSGTGVMLGICSKNDEQNALSGLEHPASALKREDFVSFKANWDPKHVNLEQAAGELNIGLDSVVFADDNPAEREIVTGFLPQVEAVPLTAPEDYVKTLDRQGYFEVAALSADDVNRNKTYQQNAQRAAAQALFSDYGEYLRSLEMVCRVDRFRAPDPRRETYVDAAGFEGGEPLIVRGVQPGDRIQPLGMSGTRKLQDVLVDLRVPAAERPRVPLIVCGDRIVWVCGFLSAEQGRITADTRELVRFSIEMGSIL
jgi:tRNA(Ile)-lysidine synthetase-like protein